MALGINHVYLMLHGYDRVIERERDAMLDKRISYRQLAIYTLVEVMPSITVAVIFEIVALLSGLFVQFILHGPMPGLHIFVIVSVIGVALDYFFLNGVFFPPLLLDIKRIMVSPPPPPHRLSYITTTSLTTPPPL